MAESYEGNGDYSFNDEEADFKRKRDRSDMNGTNGGEPSTDIPEDDATNGEDTQTAAQKINDYVRDCQIERTHVEKDYPISTKLLSYEIEIIQKTGRMPVRDSRYADIYKERPLRLSQKIRVPIREHPKFNFVGKILGPKGNSLKRLQEDTLCKMTVLGRNSMRDRVKEDELRASMDPKYAHLNDDLHVEISTIAPPAEAYARMAYALAELRKYLTPDSNDEVRQEQLRELMENPPPELEGKIPQYKKVAPVTTKYRAAANPSHQPPQSRTTGPQKKVYSILEKARTAIDDSYRHPHAQQSGRAPYESYEYDHTDYGRVDYYSQPQTYSVKQPPSSSESRPGGWKPPSTVVPSYGGGSRRHDEHMISSSHAPTSGSKHAYSSREARYKTAPYTRVGK